MQKTILVMVLIAVFAAPGCTKKAAEVYKSPFFDPDPNATAPRKHEGGY
jgi:hypothetical protein